MSGCSSKIMFLGDTLSLCPPCDADHALYILILVHQVGNTKCMWNECFNIYIYSTFPEKWYTNCFWAYWCSRQQGLFWQVTCQTEAGIQLASTCLCDVRVVNADNASTCSTAAHTMQESNASCQMMTCTPYHVLINTAPGHIFVNHMIRSRLIASYGALVVNMPCDKLRPIVCAK